MKPNLKYLSVFLPLLFIFSGCFDIKRDIKLYPNGSGEERISISLDKSLFETFQQYAAMDPTGNASRKIDSLMNNELLQQNIVMDYQRAPGISFKEAVVSSLPDGGKNISIYYLFDEPSLLVRTVKEATMSFSNQPNVNFANLKFTDEEDRLKFRYVLRNATRFYDDTVALSVFSDMINSKRVSYSIEMPFEVLSSNAHSQSGNVLNWEFDIKDILYNQVEMNAEMVRPQGIDLPFAEKLEKDNVKIEKSKNPLLRVVVFNGNREEVKIGTGVVLDDGLMITNFRLMNVLEGLGYYAIRLNNDSLAGIDDMGKNDIVQNLDMIFLRFNNNESVKPLKYSTIDQASPGKKIKIFYYPNTLSSVAYAMDGEIMGTKGWTGNNKIIEIKPNKPLNAEGGAVFDENGNFVGMLTTAYSGTVGRIYAIPAAYIKLRLPKM